MYKQVIVVRKDLGMDKGKIAAQVAHASLEAYKETDLETRERWEEGGSKKVVLKVENLKKLMELKERVKSERIPYAVIRDAGKTQIEPGTVTSLGIGPVEEDRIDRLTKELKLL
ncbi:MAG: peptidyl-tRNA hydrolase [Candidatus Aenigmarchaeota archaeon]|nr:peptidyl-tRNA hydrolase [Candidatus Aenigmarchaeota archaeon]NIP40114.1 peptidyl-tRNA hydrolase [Candidatus Aenigmarchaeota archaeon]NIQ18191.1 peptidyl-tRNA hydrolase [Candidatus Aenigmarchaeota archaeon]NIS72948.1 peptidyl-tRNA hydrolase [Candidatus Aenigmarchaeota archaeon]